MNPKRLNRSLILALIALTAVALLAGCGGSGDDTTDSTTTSSDSTTTDGSGPPPSTEPLTAPKADESIDDAAKRLTAAVKKEDCKAINEFLPTARADTQATKAGCKMVQARLDGAEVDGTDTYDDSAAVIDFTRGARITTALMVVDRTGRYKLAQLNGFLGEKTAGTKLAPEFDKAAKTVTKAFADNDCKAFRENASALLGPGNTRRSDKLVCAYVKAGPVARLLKENPKAKPELMGGNSQVAFYGLSSDTLFLTMLMTRQSDKNLPEGIKLPDGAAEYVFLDAVPTNAAPAAG